MCALHRSYVGPQRLVTLSTGSFRGGFGVLDDDDDDSCDGERPAGDTSSTTTCAEEAAETASQGVDGDTDSAQAYGRRRGR